MVELIEFLKIKWQHHFLPFRKLRGKAF